MIRELRQELAKLQSMLAAGKNQTGFEPEGFRRIVADFDLFSVSGGETVTEQLETSKKLMNQLNLTWDEKLSQTQSMQVCGRVLVRFDARCIDYSQKERESALREMGIALKDDGGLR